MPSPPALYYTTADEPEEPAFETWRRIMLPMYDIRPGSRAGRHPGGGVIAYLLGDMMANRTVFTAQRIARDRRRIDSTPDHVVFQYWRTGGYDGEIAGRPVAYGPGTVALADRRRTLEGRFAPADTVGLVVPRVLLAGIDLDAADVRFDPARNRLLAARLTALYREVARTGPEAIPALRAELLAFLLRVLDPSTAGDVLEGRELDRGLLALAEDAIQAGLGRPDLTPQTLADELRISRATLYRLFAPLGGVMAHVQDQRLLAVRDALADPLETRTIARLAADHGLGSPALLSRRFRARFEATPRAWRAHNRERARMQAWDRQTHERFWAWFHGLGRPGRA